MCFIACSALKRKYRETLRGKGKEDEHSDLQTYFVYRASSILASLARQDR